MFPKTLLCLLTPHYGKQVITRPHRVCHVTRSAENTLTDLLPGRPAGRRRRASPGSQNRLSRSLQAANSQLASSSSSCFLPLCQQLPVSGDDAAERHQPPTLLQTVDQTSKCGSNLIRVRLIWIKAAAEGLVCLCASSSSTDLVS